MILKPAVLVVKPWQVPLRGLLLSWMKAPEIKYEIWVEYMEE